MIDELKNNRPLPDLELLDENNQFSSYIARLMKGNLPKSKKILLQGKIIAIIMKEIEQFFFIYNLMEYFIFIFYLWTKSVPLFFII